jgi:uncharacterized protein GlcG (DUF336 family)
MNTISTARAEEIIRRACVRADEIGMAACIAVVDAGAHLKAFRRMDGAFTGAVDVSQRKARTTGMELTNGGLAAFHGGLPIMDGEVLTGAIGVSGGSAEQDLDVARYALAVGEAW